MYILVKGNVLPGEVVVADREAEYFPSASSDKSP